MIEGDPLRVHLNLYPLRRFKWTCVTKKYSTPGFHLNCFGTLSIDQKSKKWTDTINFNKIFATLLFQL